jgi:RHH-type proline utilization regulon transcriptional repressor/proline dehydrogenase/delta 1-pyrroline-5-carboxylate dehydrogenase
MEAEYHKYFGERTAMTNVLLTDRDIDALANESVITAQSLIFEASQNRKRYDQATRRRFSKLFKDPTAVSVTVSLTDEVIRIPSSRHAARILQRTATRATIAGFGIINALGLKFIARVSNFAPNLSLWTVNFQVKRLSRGIILPAESKNLSKHISSRSQERIKLNINVLGEAVLGEHEAQDRFESVLEMMNRKDVDYVSVKISSVVSQIIILDQQGTLDRVSKKLRILYDISLKTGTFVNLDMEDFRDLRITVDAFKLVLSEKEFETLYAGLVLQAYLPESHAVFAELVQWSLDRHKRSGGVIKIRLVKGANLVMETAESELHGWVSAPYKSKADVDASYSRLLDVALRSDHAEAVRIGVASHNLFHTSFALEIAKKRGVLDQLDIEMLEGMANPQALAIANRKIRILLYVPVTTKNDFASAVAYLVRRLDENTSVENYLRASFDIESNSKNFSVQSQRFLKSTLDRHSVSTKSLRHEVNSLVFGEIFENAPEADLTNQLIVLKLEKEINDILEVMNLSIPIVSNGKEIYDRIQVTGLDPNDGNKPWYSYAVANKDDVNTAVECAKESGRSWNQLGARKRAEILWKFSAIAHTELERTAAILSRDAGKTINEAIPEISEAIDFANFYAHSSLKLDLDKSSSPIGPVVVVPPWNFPYAIPTGGICAALAAGNSVIFKSAPETVAVAWHLVNQLWRAGVPKEVLQFISTKNDEVGQSLIMHNDVGAVILTGAYATAELFTSWKNDLTLFAETSGKNSIILTACCDVDLAVRDLVQSAFGHAGQKCSACSLAIVEKSVYESENFKKQLVDATKSLVVGAGYHYATSVSPLIKPAEKDLKRVLTSLDDGEEWLLEPKKLDELGLRWSPGIKVGVSPGSWSHLNEWFGPVLAIMVAPDFKTSLEWQNSTPYGLTAGVQSLDQNECDYWIENVEAGNLYVNRGITGAIVDRQPFGGWKRSSVGATSKAGGSNYVAGLRIWERIQNFSETKKSMSRWLNTIGNLALDESGLSVEKNFQRYRYFEKGVAVRLDSGICESEYEFLKWLSTDLGISLHLSSELPLPGVENLVVESRREFALNAFRFDRVRWLSSEAVPTTELMKFGISCDTRPIASRGEIEASRWFLEQSVSITQHRYGNTNAGPKPACPGLNIS